MLTHICGWNCLAICINFSGIKIYKYIFAVVILQYSKIQLFGQVFRRILKISALGTFFLKIISHLAIIYKYLRNTLSILFVKMLEKIPKIIRKKLTFPWKSGRKLNMILDLILSFRIFNSLFIDSFEKFFAYNRYYACNAINLQNNCVNYNLANR